MSVDFSSNCHIYSKQGVTVTDLDEVLQQGFTGSLIEWATLIDFIDKNKNTLKKDDLIRLFILSEQYRNYFNTERLEAKQIEKNGKYFTTQTRKKPLDIRRENIYPRIYEYIPPEIDANNITPEVNLEVNDNILQQQTPAEEHRLTGWAVSLASS